MRRLRLSGDTAAIFTPPTRKSNDWHARGDEGHWDPPGRIVMLGVLMPLALLAWAAFNGWSGWARFPGRRGGGGIVFEVATAPIGFYGLVAVKIIGAAMAAAYWGLGNHPRLGWYRDWFMLPLLVLMVFACVAVVAGLLGTLR